MKIYTIGSGNKSAKQFFELLRKNKIQKVIDIRLKNQSQLLGFAKGKDIAYFLTEIFGIAYEHVPELAPTQEILHNYQDKNRKDTYYNWDIYRIEFNKLLNSRDISAIFTRVAQDYEAVAFLCSEPKADKCHRRLVAEYLQKRDSNIYIEHI